MVRKLYESLTVFDQARPGLRFFTVVGVWVALLLGAVNVRVYMNDNIPNVLIPVSLLCEGNVELSEFKPVLEKEPEGERYWAVRSERGLYSKYPIWTGVITTPFFIPFVFQRVEQFDEYALLRCGRLVALVLSAVFAGALACSLRVIMPGGWAIFLTFSAIFGSALWHHLGSHLTNQALPNVCIVLMLLLLVRDEMTKGRAFATGLLAGLAASARLPAIFLAALPLGIYLTRSSWRRFIPFVTAGGLVFPGLTLWYQKAAFGQALRTGYSFDVRDTFTEPMLEGAVGLLVSPTCGLLVYSPFVLMGIWIGLLSLHRMLRRALCGSGAPSDESLGYSYSIPPGRGGGGSGYDTPEFVPARREGIVAGPLADSPETSRSGLDSQLAVWIFLGCVGQWLLFAKWWCWHGALTFGCRMLAETVAPLVLLIGLGWSKRVGRWARAVLVVCGVGAVLHHLVGTVAYQAVSQENILKSGWDWGEDFIQIHIRRQGIAFAAGGITVSAGLFAVVLLLGGYLGSTLLRKDHN